MADANHDDDAERASVHLSVSWTRSVFVVGVVLVFALNAALVGAVLASVAMRQQEGDLYRDRLVNLLYTAVWCGSTLVVMVAVVEAWRDGRRFHQNHTTQDAPDTACECIERVDVAFAARVCNRTWRHKRLDEAACGDVGVRQCTWRIVTWHCTAPDIVTFVATGADDHVPFEAHGTAHRARTDDTLCIAWTQTCTASAVPRGDTRFFSGAVEPAGPNHDDVIRGLQTLTAPLAPSSKLVFYSRDDDVARDDNGDREQGSFFVPADYYAMRPFSLGSDSLV